jgi:hypothetical protein
MIEKKEEERDGIDGRTVGLNNTYLPTQQKHIWYANGKRQPPASSAASEPFYCHLS